MDSADSNEPLAPAVAEGFRTPRKRQKRTIPHDTALDIQPSRKGKSCSICRKLKVKCDSVERGMNSCSRCLRLGLQCISEKKSWVSAESSEERPQQLDIVLFKLERALEDVLQKLNMPALDLYANPAIVKPLQSPRPTRQNSQEPVSGADKRSERDVSPGPMRSLIEATRLNGLCSELRSVKQRKKGGMRRMDSDLISEKVLSYEEAEEMLEL